MSAEGTPADSAALALQAKFDEFTELVRKAAAVASQIIDPSVTFPPALKARYEAVTKLEEAHMWLGNGVGAMMQRVTAPPAGQSHPGWANQAKVMEGGADAGG